MKIKEVAKLTGLSEKRISQYAREHKLPKMVVNGVLQYHFTDNDVQDVLARKIKNPVDNQ